MSTQDPPPPHRPPSVDPDVDLSVPAQRAETAGSAGGGSWR
nr:hypothetical protein [Streptomyces sp. KA12]